MYFSNEPYDLGGHIKYHGSGYNLYRGEDFAQPRALKVGDVLSNGWTIVDDSRESYNGGVEVRFDRWVTRRIAARLPLQLQSERPGVLPMDLQVGQIFQTGDVILDEPRPLTAEETEYFGRGLESVSILLTGGREGHRLAVHSDIELAVSDETYPPNPGTKFGTFVLENTMRMDENARQHLSGR